MAGLAKEKAVRAIQRMKAGRIGLSGPDMTSVLWAGDDGAIRRGHSGDMVTFLDDIRVPTIHFSQLWH